MAKSHHSISVNIIKSVSTNHLEWGNGNNINTNNMNMNNMINNNFQGRNGNIQGIN